VQGRFDLAEAVEEFVVIVGGDEAGGGCAGIAAAPGVAGDPAGVAGSGGGGERAGAVVVEGADDDGLGPGHGDLDGAAEENAVVVAALEVFHFAGATGGDPGVEAVGIGSGGVGVGREDGRDSAGVEACVKGILAEPAIEIGCPSVGGQGMAP
jgi:hypothetical protein